MSWACPWDPLFGYETFCEQFLQAFRIGCGGFGHEAGGVGEVDVGLGGDTREVHAWMIIVSSESIPVAASVGIDHGASRVGEALLFDVAWQAHRRFVGERIRSREKDRLKIGAIGFERPKLGVLADEIEALTEGFQIVD